MIKVKFYNNIFFKLQTTFEQDKLLKNHMSIMIENAWFNPKYKAGIWDGRISFYDIKNCLLPIGLFDMFKDFCKQYDIEYETEFDESILKTKISDERLESLFNLLFKDSIFTPRDYQKEMASNAIREKRGIIVSATGSGKSLGIYIIIRYLLFLNKNVLLVVPSTNLCEQMYTDFVDYGWKECEENVCKMYSLQSYDEDKPVLISTWQSLQNKEKEFFTRFGGMLIDECLHPDTLITMDDGSKKQIKELIVNEIVKTYNEAKNRIEEKKIVKVHKNEGKELYNIETNEGVLFKKGITGNHKIKTNRGWVEVKNLIEGDELLEL